MPPSHLSLLGAESIAEPAAELADGFYRRLVESVTDYAIYRLGLDGRISSWNAGAERFKHYTETEVLGRHFSLFYTPAEAEAGKPQRALTLALQTGRFEDYGWRVRKGGESFWAHVIIDLIRDDAGVPLGFAKITRDISDRRAIEMRLNDLQRSHQELEQFIHVASHDLREPLRKVLAFSDLIALDDGAALSPASHAYLASICAATRRMQALLESLLSLTKVTSEGQLFSRCDLNDVAAEVLSDLAVAIRETGARIDVAPLAVIDADPAQMRQLLQNLIENAMKYRRDDLTPHITVRCFGAVSAPHLTLQVADNGIGFDPQYGERIFGIFQRLHTRDQYSGAGVGLAICRKICRRHGGDITATSNAGQGASFLITLPRAHTPQGAGA